MATSPAYPTLRGLGVATRPCLLGISGVSPAIIGKALGHKSPHSTAIYARLTQDPVRQALEAAQAKMADPTKLESKEGKVLRHPRSSK